MRALSRHREVSALALLPSADPISFTFALSPPASAWFDQADDLSSWPSWSTAQSVSSFPHDCSTWLPAALPSFAPVDSSLSSTASTSRLPSPVTPLSPSSSSSTSSASAVVTVPTAVPTAVLTNVDEQRHSAPTLATVVHLEVHRTAEAQRRRREKAVIRRLEELCGTDDKTEARSGTTPSTVTASSTSSDEQQQQQRRLKRKRNKLSVLEASAARIERLERMLEAAESASRMSEAQKQRLSEEVSGMVARERRGMEWLDASFTLYGNSKIDACFSYTLMDCRTGRLLDANHNFFRITGYTPASILHRVLDPVLASPDSPGTPDSDLPLVRAKSQSNGCKLSAENKEAQWVPLRPLRQYPGAVRLLQELLTGKRDNYRAPFRSRWADGYAYETYPSVWLADVEWVEEADGSRWRRPLTFICAAAIDQFQRVDEDDRPIAGATVSPGVIERKEVAECASRSTSALFL